MVLHKVHVLDGPEGLLRVVLVIGLDIADPQQSDAGIVAVAVQLVQVRAADTISSPGTRLEEEVTQVKFTALLPLPPSS